MSDNKTQQLALLLIKEVKEALARGTKHYNKNGELLATPVEILKCLDEEGSVEFHPRK
jgi:hypothetical protein